MKTMSPVNPTLEFLRFGQHELPLPSRATDGAAGYDLMSAENFSLYPGDRYKVRTGFGVKLAGRMPWLECGLIRDRSGLAYRGITTRGGVIDCDYRGEISVILANESDRAHDFKVGDRIAQLLVLTCSVAGSVEIHHWEPTARGANGFGSTGGYDGQQAA